jgi:hypothetical protein
VDQVRELPPFGTLHGPGGGPSFITDRQVEVWMYQKGQRVRFFDRSANQVGHEHASVVSAQMWAYAQGWVSPTSPVWLTAGFLRERPAEESDPQDDHIFFIP